MASRQQLEKFHQHLIAIELAGFRIRSHLLQRGESDADSGASAANLKQELRQLELQLGDFEPEELGDLLSSQSIVTPIYSSSFRYWLECHEQIASLEILQFSGVLRDVKNRGMVRIGINLAILLLFGAMAFTTVWVLSLHGIRGLIEQLQIAPPWALKALLAMEPYFGWIFLAAVLIVSVAGWRIGRRLNRLGGHHDALQALQRALVAGQFAMQPNATLTSPSDTATSGYFVDSPLFKWASQAVSQQGTQASNVWRLVEQLNLTISLNRSRQASLGLPRLYSAAIGGAIALGLGLLLFFPLIQLLRIVVESTGLPR